jgi:transcriptional regulator GlxA family with amidase domain
MTTVALIAFTGAQSLDVAGPMDVFAEANRFLLPDEHYQLEIIGIDCSPLRCSNGVGLIADRHWSEVNEPIDLLLVAGGPGLVNQTFGEDFRQWLRTAASRARRFGSICSGAFILARAGLLEGKTVTTHWNYAAALADLCSGTRVEADAIYVQDGNLYTSAGVTAGIDLSLHLLREDKGSEVALNVAKRLVVFMQRAGGQSQFSPYLAQYATPRSPVAQVQQFVLANLSEELSVKELAAVANMSVRNFARTFVRETKIPPAEFVEGARLDAARALLENSVSPLKSIAYECGFKDAGRMRSAFLRRLGVTAQQYRQSFGSTR